VLRKCPWETFQELLVFVFKYRIEPNDFLRGKDCVKKHNNRNNVLYIL
jgi:hypothetical protein